jgi:hypothetical protein
MPPGRPGAGAEAEGGGGVIHFLVIIRCNYCAATYRGQAMESTVDSGYQAWMSRKSARKSGWHCSYENSGVVDYCPACAEQRKGVGREQPA